MEYTAMYNSAFFVLTPFFPRRFYLSEEHTKYRLTNERPGSCMMRDAITNVCIARED